jgi:D-alanyl-D-alanine carboxypeptidase
VASVKRNSKHVMGAVFGGASAASRNQTMRTLLNIALFKASSTKTRVPAATLVAQARTAPSPVLEPRPATRPAPVPAPEVAQVAKPKADWMPKVATAPTPVEVLAEAPVQAPLMRPPGTIEIAKVRPVLVAPRAPRQAPIVVAAASPTAVVVSTAEPEPEPVRPVSGAAPLEISLPPLASSAVPVPPTPARVTAPVAARAPAAPIAAAARAPAGAPTLAIQAAAPAAVQALAPSRGAPPSTFQQQAANLSGGASQPAYHLSGPPRAPSPSATGVEIQIGAYSSAVEADRQLGLARSKAADLIGAAPGAAQATSANGKPIWRARFGGFQAQQASSVCTELRRRQIDCLVVRAE